MESILQEALELSEEEDEESFGLPRILVVGCGGAGNNTVNRLAHVGLEGAETIAVNTDSQHLALIEADRKILIGRKLTRGQGAGGDPEVGRKAAEAASLTLREMLRGADLVFVTAGMGGGTGTGCVPVVAKLARDQGAIVVCMATTPFHVERRRVLVAEEGLDNLKGVADTLIVLDNNRLLQFAPNLPLKQAFSVIDQIIAEIIKGITETITQPSLINLDFADVRTIMSTGGASFMFAGEGSTRNSPDKIVRSALKNPLLEVDYRGAKSCLLHITGGPDLTLKEATAIAEAMTKELDEAANVIWGARIRPDFDGRIRLMAVITGVKSSQVLGKKEIELKEEMKIGMDVIK